jgi:hypothetical protein
MAYLSELQSIAIRSSESGLMEVRHYGISSRPVSKQFSTFPIGSLLMMPV